MTPHRTPSTILKLEPNVPTELALQFPTGLNVTGIRPASPFHAHQQPPPLRPRALKPLLVERSTADVSPAPTEAKEKA